MIDLVTTPPSGHQLADWVELHLIIDGAGSVTRADLSRAMGMEPLVEEPPEVFDDFDLDGATVAAEAAVRSQLHDDAAANVSVGDTVITDAIIELEDRQHAMQEHSPYVVSGDRVETRDAGTHTVQRFLTLLAARSHYGIGGELRADEPAILFERLVTVALRNLVGNGRRFGWPYREDGLEGNFEEASRRLAEEMGEKIGPLYSASPSTKDHGLDVAAWRSFNDGRPHQVVLLCQCGIGSDVENKALSVAAWADVISFSSLPLQALAFPTTLGEWKEEKQFHQARKCGVLLDRVRLVGLARDDDLPQDLRQDIERWCAVAEDKLPRRDT